MIRRFLLIRLCWLCVVVRGEGQPESDIDAAFDSGCLVGKNKAIRVLTDEMWERYMNL